MNTMSTKSFSAGRARPIVAGPLLLLLIVLGFLVPTSARAASWETVKNFAPLVPTEPNPPSWPEDVQLGGLSGMAINTTGAGGVSPGTVYTIGSSGGEWHAARYSSKGDFELAWTGVTRCGPALTPPTTCPTFPTGAPGSVDIAVDQTTGNVYVFNVGGSKVVREYKADATGPIAEFGELEAKGTATSSPGKLHGSTLNENIAVDSGGNVYVFDEDTLTDFFHRVMVFRPQTPGDYEHYIYAGKSSDIGGGFSPATRPPARPMVDNAGNLYVSGETYIEKYNSGQPSTPTCTFSLPGGGISSAAVNPATGAVFYYTYKPERQVHQLNPCSSGTFVENNAESPPFNVVPERGNLEAMAVNPTAEFPPVGRSPGLLYAGAAEACPIIGSCPKEAKGQSSLGYIFAPQLRLEPVIESESVTQVGETSATLNAQANPKGSQATYVFQYISDAAYQQNDPANRFAGAAEVPLGGAPLGSGQQSLLASATIGGLSPATAYRYRVVVTNSDGTAVGPAEAFQTFPAGAAALPDGRAYELVSPPQKSGGEVLPGAPSIASCGVECKPGLAAARFPIQVAPSGEAIAYQGQPFTLNEGSPEYDEYVSTRSSSGWQNTSLSPPLGAEASRFPFEAFGLDTNLTRDVIFAVNSALTPEAPVGYRNLFGQTVGDRFDLEPVLKSTPPNRPSTGSTGVFQLKYAGASADLSRIFFEANDALTEGTANAPAAAAGTASEFNLYEWHQGQLNLVNVQPGNTETKPGAAFGAGTALADKSHTVSNLSHAISLDGSRVFWSSASGQVYVRENGEATREIPDHVGKFLSASADGSKVLLNDGTIYDLETGTSTDLTEGSGGLQGLVGQSEDLSSVYFVDTVVLTGVANAEGAAAKPGGDNLYSWQEGAISFVGTLLPSDDSSFGIWHASPVQRGAEASPDGRWLAFNSKAELTDHNTIGACKFEPSLNKYVGSVPCEEVYLYDSESGSLTCASCNPVGAAALGGSRLLVINGSGYIPQPRFLTDAGRLYFDTQDSLSSLDTNNQVEDVYQYEPAGIGSCARVGGCVELLSTGRGSYDSNFLAADSSGNNVFFTTREQLVPRDRDALIDLYDARVGGGIAADFASPPAPCVGEGCQPPPPPLQSEPAPGSTTFGGPGNLKPKGPKKKHHKKRHHKHHKTHQKGKKHKKVAHKLEGSK